MVAGFSESAVNTTPAEKQTALFFRQPASERRGILVSLQSLVAE